MVTPGVSPRPITLDIQEQDDVYLLLPDLISVVLPVTDQFYELRHILILLLECVHKAPFKVHELVVGPTVELLRLSLPAGVELVLDVGVQPDTEVVVEDVYRQLKW